MSTPFSQSTEICLEESISQAFTYRISNGPPIDSEDNIYSKLPNDPNINPIFQLQSSTAPPPARQPIIFIVNQDNIAEAQTMIDVHIPSMCSLIRSLHLAPLLGVAALSTLDVLTSGTGMSLMNA
jgi:hypothetical protein